MARKKFSKLRQKMKSALKKRVKENLDRKERGRNWSYFKNDLPDKVKFWKVSEDEHVIDIIPYSAGPNDPMVEEGEPTYGLELKVHYDVGPEGKQFVCLAENFGKPCPVCEHRKRLRAEGADEDLVKSLYPKRRMVYNIICYDSREEEEKGIQIWESAHWFTERLFLELAKGNVRPARKKGETSYIPFADPDEGKSIAFKREGSGATNTQYLAHRFVDRDYIIEDDILDSAYTLDELIHIPTYEELYEAYWGESSEEETVDTEEGDVPIDTDSDGVTVIDEDEEEGVPFDVDDEPDDKPKKESKLRRRRRRRKKEEKKDDECPHGGTFGKDCDELDECEECDLWEKCADKADEMGL